MEGRTVVNHVKWWWCIIIIYSRSLIQESEKENGVTTDSSWMLSLSPIRARAPLHARAKFVTSRCDSPNAGHVFANLRRISTLKLAQLGVLFDLEENFLARWAYHLDERHLLRSSRRNTRQSQTGDVRTLMLIVSGFSGLTSSWGCCWEGAWSASDISIDYISGWRSWEIITTVFSNRVFSGKRREATRHRVAWNNYVIKRVVLYIHSDTLAILAQRCTIYWSLHL